MSVITDDLGDGTVYGIAGYASAADMIARFSEPELIRLSTPSDQDLTTVQTEVVERALIDASALIDTYLRHRYGAPIAGTPPPEINRAACVLARYDLMHGDQREPTEQARLARKEVIDWLQKVSDGQVQINLIPVADTTTARPRMQTRHGGLISGACSL